MGRAERFSIVLNRNQNQTILGINLTAFFYYNLQRITLSFYRVYYAVLATALSRSDARLNLFVEK